MRGYNINVETIPEHMRDGVNNYLEYGLEPGDFLQAVLENNLVEAFGRADHINSACMFDWASFLYNDMPGEAWGSAEKVVAWMKARQDETKKEEENGNSD